MKLKLRTISFHRLGYFVLLITNEIPMQLGLNS